MNDRPSSNGLHVNWRHQAKVNPFSSLSSVLTFIPLLCLPQEAGVYKGKGPFAICMAPTRELALQINEVLEDAGSRCGVNTVCVYGGVPKPPQLQALKAGVAIVVGTPGRMEDLIDAGACRLNVSDTITNVFDADGCQSPAGSCPTNGWNSQTKMHRAQIKTLRPKRLESVDLLFVRCDLTIP